MNTINSDQEPGNKFAPMSIYKDKSSNPNLLEQKEQMPPMVVSPSSISSNQKLKKGITVTNDSKQGL